MPVALTQATVLQTTALNPMRLKTGWYSLTRLNVTQQFFNIAGSMQPLIATGACI